MNEFKKQSIIEHFKPLYHVWRSISLEEKSTERENEWEVGGKTLRDKGTGGEKEKKREREKKTGTERERQRENQRGERERKGEKGKRERERKGESERERERKDGGWFEQKHIKRNISKGIIKNLIFIAISEILQSYECSLSFEY